MEKDKFIENLFADFKPELNDSDRFMAALESKLEAVEYIRKMQRAQLRRYRLAMVVALVLAVMAGIILFFVLNALPEGVRLFSFHTDFAPLVFLEQNSRIITLVATALLVSYGIIACSSLLSRR